VQVINLIRNCKFKFRMVCPQRWEQLTPTPAEGVKFCGTCHQDVFFCETDAEALGHARAGHCIAKPMPDLSGLSATSLVLGRPKVPATKPTPQERRLEREAGREAAKTRALEDIEYASRACPRCGYPCVDWLRICEVCGLEIGRHDSGTRAE
jgi:hypothetical protein